VGIRFAPVRGILTGKPG